MSLTHRSHTEAQVCLYILHCAWRKESKDTKNKHTNTLALPMINKNPASNLQLHRSPPFPDTTCKRPGYIPKAEPKTPEHRKSLIYLNTSLLPFYICPFCQALQAFLPPKIHPTSLPFLSVLFHYDAHYLGLSKHPSHSHRSWGQDPRSDPGYCPSIPTAAAGCRCERS
jgi:hypothetical protein